MESRGRGKSDHPSGESICFFNGINRKFFLFSNTEFLTLSLYIISRDWESYPHLIPSPDFSAGQIGLINWFLLPQV